MNNILTHLAAFVAGGVVGVFLSEWILSTIMNADHDKDE